MPMSADERLTLLQESDTLERLIADVKANGVTAGLADLDGSAESTLAGKAEAPGPERCCRD